MNIFKKFYARTYQKVFKLMIPMLPYREPEILNNNDDVARVLKDKQLTKVLLVTDEGIRNLNLTLPLENLLSEQGIEVCVYDKTVPNPTTNNVAEGLAIYKENACQAIIAVGGGSVIDCAKGIGAKVAKPKKSLRKMKGVLKVRKKIPSLIAVPTTAGTGSETTLACVITDSETRHKYAINDFPLIPSYALLDANLTLGLPKHITATTAMDALTHAIEAYIGKSTTKDTRVYALDAIKMIFANILEVYNNPNNFEARHNMLFASYKAGLAFTKSYVGYVHAIAHSLGGKYNIAHGLANAVILPIVLKKYGRKIYTKLWEMGTYAGLFDTNTTIEKGAKLFINHIENLNQQMNIPSSIPQIIDEDIPNLAQTAEKEGNPLYPVPVLWTKEKFENVYMEIKNGQ
ncbi:MAG: iron-containing alcohol dehydrogenase [Clostridiales bacterium]|nr:iron-containing alcohol dehydrogenase [Clostridiales bacterium]